MNVQKNKKKVLSQQHKETQTDTVRYTQHKHTKKSRKISLSKDPPIKRDILTNHVYTQHRTNTSIALTCRPGRSPNTAALKSIQEEAYIYDKRNRCDEHAKCVANETSYIFGASFTMMSAVR